MIVVDSSVWINYFNGKQSFETEMLNDFLGAQDLIIGDLILLEVLQGFKSDHKFTQAKYLFESLNIVNIAGYEISLIAAYNYRKLRKKGLTIRKTIDVIIATYCIENNYKLLYSDRDFDIMKTYLGLKTFALI